MARPRTTVPTKPDDPRVQRSVDLLSDALLSLLEGRSFEDISIRDITDQAGVSYPTFFRRFSGKDDLLNHIAAEEIRRLLNLSQLAITKPAGEESGQLLCDYVQAHRKLWKTLLNGGAALVMREEFMRAANEIAASGRRKNPWIPADLAVPFVTSAVFELLAWWMRQPEEYPEQNVVTLFDALIIDSVVRPRDVSLI